jgi:hypothetical protein
MSERVVELTDEMLNAGAAALDHFDGPIPADHHERWGVVSLILVAALREAPYPASRPEAPAEGPERAATGETLVRCGRCGEPFAPHPDPARFDHDFCEACLPEAVRYWGMMQTLPERRATGEERGA